MKVTKEEFIGVTYDELLALNDELLAFNDKLLAENEHMRLKDMAVMGELAEENELLKSDNAKLRELVRDVWHLFTEHGAVNPCDLPVVDAVRDRMRELGVEVDG